jgi:hypothetical protein
MNKPAMDEVNNFAEWLRQRAEWLHKEICDGGNLEHLQARRAECQYIASMLPLYVRCAPRWTP